MSGRELAQNTTILALMTAASKSVFAVVQERAEQKILHGYGASYDKRWIDHQLLQAAEAVLAVDSDSYENSLRVANELWPDGWDPAMLNHIVQTKDYLHRLAVAGALILAEMDCIIMKDEELSEQEAEEPD